MEFGELDKQCRDHQMILLRPVHNIDVPKYRENQQLLKHFIFNILLVIDYRLE